MLDRELDSATLIVCHPDDEVLWFSSILARVRRIVIVYGPAPGMPGLEEGRRKSANEYPLESAEFWQYTESMSFQTGNWAQPSLDEMGLVLRDQGRLPGFDKQVYVNNFQQLVSDLAPITSESTCLITHNPWGEYGHEDHVMLNRAVTQAAQSASKPVWYNNYVSDRSAKLMGITMSGQQKVYERFPTDKDLVDELQELYVKQNCWTWPYPDYRCPEDECMILSDATSSYGHASGALVPLNYVDVDGGYSPPRPDRSFWKNRKFRIFRGHA